jgi:hypothetical protein
VRFMFNSAGLSEPLSSGFRMSSNLPRFGIALLLPAFAQAGCGGGQSGDEGTLHSQPPSVLGTPTSAAPYCRHEVSYGPGDRSETYQCEITDQRYLSGELRWRNGQPTPSGPYHCYCPGSTQEVPAAESCEDALTLGCGVDLAAPQRCSVSDQQTGGACWPVLGSPGSWRCRCGLEDVLTSVEQEDCRSAWFAACAASCARDAGACEPSSSDGGVFPDGPAARIDDGPER